MTGSQISLFQVHMPRGVDESLLEVLHSGKITQGEKVDEYESAIKYEFGFPNVLSLNSCTSAIQLALRLANVEPGDEVITTPMTCAATNLPILAAGAHPVWADIDPYTGNIVPESVFRMVGPKTKAVIAVDWAGLPALTKQIRMGLPERVSLIEDAAHALGAERQNKYIGSEKDGADFICFSTQAIKHITTGDGGLLVCKDPDDYRRGKKLRWFGIDRESMLDDRIESDISDWGYKFHMNDLNATIGLAQIPYIRSIVYRHRKNAGFYDADLTAYYRRVQRADILAGDDSSCWLYTVRMFDSEIRDRFVQKMRSSGVQVSRVHARTDRHSCFAGARSDTLGGVDAFDGTQVNLPVHWALSDEDRDRVLDLCSEFAAADRAWV